MITIKDVKVIKEDYKPSRYVTNLKPIEYVIENSCWVCINRKANAKGYILIGRNNKYILVHRYVYELYNGEIPKGMVIMHLCDNPRCINPSHLKAGTQLENMQDRDDKKRQAKGSKHGISKLKEYEVLEILMLLKLGVKPKEIAKKFNTNEIHISQIKNKYCWKHLSI